MKAIVKNKISPPGAMKQLLRTDLRFQHATKVFNSSLPGQYHLYTKRIHFFSGIFSHLSGNNISLLRTSHKLSQFSCLDFNPFEMPEFP